MSFMSKQPRIKDPIKNACFNLEKALNDFEKVICKDSSLESQKYKKELKSKIQEIQKKLDYLS